MPFKSRAVQSLVELHRQEMLNFLKIWGQFKASQLTLPPAFGDPHYESYEALYGHILESARSDLTWVCQLAGIPIATPDPGDIHAILEAYVRHLSDLGEDALYVTRPVGEGMSLSLETILEHGIVHAMRHRHQLEKWM